MAYMETYNPDYVLILSGDHIYKMDYEVMLDYHKANKADVTIACGLATFSVSTPSRLPWPPANSIAIISFLIMQSPLVIYSKKIISHSYQQIKGSEWYKGTANAIYQNINFIDRYNPEYVAVLSGDHIYKMDYSKMLDYHKEKGAACTIAMLEVPWEEAPRFGLMITDEDNAIKEFEEKPKNPSLKAESR